MKPVAAFQKIAPLFYGKAAGHVLDFPLAVVDVSSRLTRRALLSSAEEDDVFTCMDLTYPLWLIVARCCMAVVLFVSVGICCFEMPATRHTSCSNVMLLCFQTRGFAWRCMVKTTGHLSLTAMSLTSGTTKGGRPGAKFFTPQLQRIRAKSTALARYVIGSYVFGRCVYGLFPQKQRVCQLSADWRTQWKLITFACAVSTAETMSRSANLLCKQERGSILAAYAKPATVMQAFGNRQRDTAQYTVNNLAFFFLSF